MAMSVTYTTFSGMIVHENRGGVERAYVPDTLGSTQALIDDTETVTDTWECWPYGEVSQRTGTNSTPFTFVGMLGYFKDLLDKLLYIRARYLRVDLARWLTVDSLWPQESAYSYTGGSPAVNIDPSGKAILPILCIGACIAAVGCGAGVWIACGGLWGQEEFGQCVIDYIDSLPVHSKIGCLVGIAGCLACLIKALRDSANRRTSCALAKAMKEACCTAPRRCTKADDCAALKTKLALRMCCHTGRLSVGKFCFCGVDDRHVPPLLDEARGIKTCLAEMAHPKKNCLPFKSRFSS